MASDTESKEAPLIAPHVQDFSDSDDEILDNFADGPMEDPKDVPMGLGGEKGKQAEPASSTLEADIVSGTTKQPGETSPSEIPASEPDPVQEPAGEKEKGAETSPEPDVEEPETPEFPQALLQMGNFADAAAAQAAGFQTPEALFAAIKWRGQLLVPGEPSVQPSGQGLYRRSAPQPLSPAPPAPETAVETEGPAELKPFELSKEKMDMLDEDLQGVLRDMNEHHQKQVQSLRSELKQRDELLASQQEQNEEIRFDKAVQELGGEWQDVFGEGDGADLAQAGQVDPVAMTNLNHRAMLFEAVEAVREVNARQGYKPMSLEQEIQWALMQRYPDKFQQVISKKPSAGSTQRGVTASRPTQRRTPVTAKDQLLRDLHKKYPDAGFMQQSEDEFEGEI